MRLCPSSGEGQGARARRNPGPPLYAVLCLGCLPLAPRPLPLMNSSPQKIPVVGIGPDGAAGLSVRCRELLGAAEMVFGSDAALRLLPELSAERIAIGADLPAAVERLRAALGKKRIAVVASGDPLFYGTARYFCEKVGAEQFDVVPHVSSMQHAFARIKETWEEAYLSDLSSRALEDVIDKIRTNETVGLFTSEINNPARVAREL